MYELVVTSHRKCYYKEDLYTLSSSFKGALLESNLGPIYSAAGRGTSLSYEMHNPSSSH
jgi:hypothetical protein